MIAEIVQEITDSGALSDDLRDRIVEAVKQYKSR